MKTLATLALAFLASCTSPRELIYVKANEPTAKLYHFERDIGTGSAKAFAACDRQHTFRAVADDGRTVSVTIEPVYDWSLWRSFAGRSVRLSKTEVYLDIPPAPQSTP